MRFLPSRWGIKITKWEIHGFNIDDENLFILQHYYFQNEIKNVNSPLSFSRAVSKALLREFTVDSENKKNVY